MRKKRFVFVGVLLAAGCGLAASTASAQTPDFQWTFDNNSFLAYRLTSVSSSNVYSGSLPADNPTLNMTVGKRYGVTIVNFLIHPFQVLAKGGSSASDVVLLSETGGGSLQSDPGIAWADDGAGHVQFTVTQTLLNTMNAGGHIPGYRCGVHVDTMRGNFNISSPPAFDFQWTFNNNGTLAYRLTSVSSAAVYPGTLPADNPTLNLTVGKRYRVTVVNFAIHPFQVIAKAPGASFDTVLLSMGSTAGSFESDPGVVWNDDGAGNVTFTVTPALLNAMNTVGHVPGYRCGVHVNVMRGNFNLPRRAAVRESWNRYE